MQKEYIGSLGNRHNLTKYTLSNGAEVILNEEELEELYNKSPLTENVQSLESQLLKSETQREHYRSIILDFNSVLNEIQKVR